MVTSNTHSTGIDRSGEAHFNGDVDQRHNGYGTLAGDDSDIETELEVADAGKAKKNAAVSWMSLPNKKQLAVLVTARLSEPLVQTSLQVIPTPCNPRLRFQANPRDALVIYVLSAQVFRPKLAGFCHCRSDGRDAGEFQGGTAHDCYALGEGCGL
jgi:hypothetical protein